MGRLRKTVDRTRDALRSGWRDFLSIYYANSYTWRLMKSGGLAFFGFFCWAASNLLLSVRPEWTLLYYVMAYGLLLIPYGPFTHLVVVPLAIRWRKRPPGTLNTLAKRVSKLNITVFLLAVIAVGFMAPGFMILDFESYGGDGVDVDPELDCVEGDGEVTCTLSDEPGIGRVVVSSAGEEVLVLDEPPWEFTVRKDELVEVTGSRRLLIEVQTEEGDTLRSFRRRF